KSSCGRCRNIIGDSNRGSSLPGVTLGQKRIGWISDCSRLITYPHQMIVLRHLRRQQSNIFAAARLTDRIRTKADSVALMNGNTALQIRQGERLYTVPAVISSKQGKQCGVLADGQQLPVAKCPFIGREVPANHPDLTEKWF